MTEVQDGEALLGFKTDSIYEIVGRMAPGLMLDLGAASGATAAQMLQASPQSRVIGFEPFPGNLPFFKAKHENDPRVRLVPKAVSNHNDTQKFYVSRVVQDGKGSWKGMDGYSSVGQLVTDDHPHAQEAITVETCRLDDEVHEKVAFMKIDVQGAEYEVLDGARELFDRHGVDVMYIEFSGDQRILDFLAERGYSFYDTEYMIVLKRLPDDSPDWRVVKRGTVSTGVPVGYGWPTGAPRDLAGYSQFVDAQRRRLGHVQTDLVAVAPGALQSFLAAAEETRRVHAPA